jgi:hypothetical protein
MDAIRIVAGVPHYKGRTEKQSLSNDILHYTIRHFLFGIGHFSDRWPNRRAGIARGPTENWRTMGSGAAVTRGGIGSMSIVPALRAVGVELPALPEEQTLAHLQSS